jgi:hypothetical protein
VYGDVITIEGKLPVKEQWVVVYLGVKKKDSEPLFGVWDVQKKRYH